MSRVGFGKTFTGWVAWLCLAAVFFAVVPASAQINGNAAVAFYTEEPLASLSVKTVASRTVIDGPLARTQISYTVANPNTTRVEVGFNIHVPPGTVLHGFGYYYKGRFIPGRMYDTAQAWKIYTAVTSRGRDPGIMDRPSPQDYHVQVYPVEARQDLRVVVQLTQAMPTDNIGAHFELPLTQGFPYFMDVSDIKRDPVQVRAEVVIDNHTLRAVQDNYGAVRESEDGSAVLRLVKTWLPKDNWRITIRRHTSGPARSVYSALSGRKGFFALSVSAPYPLVRPRIALGGNCGTDLSLPTRFGDIPAYQPLLVTGLYHRPASVMVTVSSANRPPLRFRVHLRAASVPERQNAAGVIWADKRIGALQDSGRPQLRTAVVDLSKRFTIVSNFTALLAIPREELNYYRTVLARQKINTNTQDVGGGGGDPYISVKAPADAARVVAVFPDGDVKDLTYSTARQTWEGRFDIPFGTPAGDFRVTVIVVHPDGTRSRFVLLYENLLSGPQAGNLTTLTARPGGSVTVHVSGEGIARAVAVAPWGERVTLGTQGGDWSGQVHVPSDWPLGASQVTVVLLDGAHNRTEVTVDLDVR